MIDQQIIELEKEVERLQMISEKKLESLNKMNERIEIEGQSDELNIEFHNIRRELSKATDKFQQALIKYQLLLIEKLSK